MLAFQYSVAIHLAKPGLPTAFCCSTHISSSQVIVWRVRRFDLVLLCRFKQTT